MTLKRMRRSRMRTNRRLTISLRRTRRKKMKASRWSLAVFGFFRGVCKLQTSLNHSLVAEMIRRCNSRSAPRLLFLILISIGSKQDQDQEQEADLDLRLFSVENSH